MKSKTKLFILLTELTNDNTWQEEGLNHSQITDETYGKSSHIYVGLASIQEREYMENLIEQNGFKVNRGYWKGSTCTEVEVSYFKGYHWDE